MRVFAEIVAASDDPDEWDRLTQAFDTDWKAAYTQHFVEFAVSRGWSKEAAESWPGHIVDDALIDGAMKNDWSPIRTAEEDVAQCECSNIRNG